MDATTDQPEASTSSAPPQETTVRFVVDGPEELPSTSPVRKRRKPKTRTDDASNTVPPPSATTNLAVPNTVTEEIASQAMRYFIAGQFRAAGFAGAAIPCLEEMERLVLSFVIQLYTNAVSYSNVSNRTQPHARDLVAACQAVGIDIPSLRKTARKTKKRKVHPPVITLRPDPVPPPPPAFLPSDSSGDEADDDVALLDLPTSANGTVRITVDKDASKDSAETSKDGAGAGNPDSAKPPDSPETGKKSRKRKKDTDKDKEKEKEKGENKGKGKDKSGGGKKNRHTPRTLRDLPKHMPNLPPKHTYLRTPPAPPPLQTLPALNKAHASSVLMQASLKSLIDSTSDPAPEPMVLPSGHPALIQERPGMERAGTSQIDRPPLDRISSGNGTLGGRAPMTLEQNGMGGLVNWESFERSGMGRGMDVVLGVRPNAGGIGIGVKRKKWRV